jgi:hypothetical protein
VGSKTPIPQSPTEKNGVNDRPATAHRFSGAIKNPPRAFNRTNKFVGSKTPIPQSPIEKNGVNNRPATAHRFSGAIKNPPRAFNRTNKFESFAIPQPTAQSHIDAKKSSSTE